MLTKTDEVKIGVRAHCEIYLAGFALTATPGKVGEAVRSYYLKPYGVPINKSLAALLAERILDTFSVLMISILAIIHFTEYRMLGTALLISVCLLVALIRSKLLIRILSFGLGLNSPTLIKRMIQLLIDTIISTRSYMTGEVWFIGLLIGIVAWGAEAYGFYLLLMWITGTDMLLLASGIYAFSMIIGAISLLPGGVGGAEVTMAGLLVLIGVSISDATTATIICRLVTLWFAVLIGVLFLSRLKIPTDMEHKNG